MDVIEIQIFVNGEKVIEHNDSSRGEYNISSLLNEENRARDIFTQLDKLSAQLKGFLLGTKAEGLLAEHRNRRLKQPA